MSPSGWTQLYFETVIPHSILQRTTPLHHAGHASEQASNAAASAGTDRPQPGRARSGTADTLGDADAVSSADDTGDDDDSMLTIVTETDGDRAEGHNASGRPLPAGQPAPAAEQVPGTPCTANTAQDRAHNQHDAETRPAVPAAAESKHNSPGTSASAHPAKADVPASTAAQPRQHEAAASTGQASSTLQGLRLWTLESHKGRANIVVRSTGERNLQTDAKGNEPHRIQPIVFACKMAYHAEKKNYEGGKEQFTKAEATSLSASAMLHPDAQTAWARINPHNDSIIQLEMYSAQDVFKAFPSFDTALAVDALATVVDALLREEPGQYLVTKRVGAAHLTVYKSVSNDTRATTMEFLKHRKGSLLEPLKEFKPGPPLVEMWEDFKKYIKFTFAPISPREFKFCYKYADQGHCNVEHCAFLHMTKEEIKVLGPETSKRFSKGPRNTKSKKKKKKNQQAQKNGLAPEAQH